jgi:anti-repressor protein
MNELQKLFDYQGKQVRTNISKNDEPIFCGRDVLDILDLETSEYRRVDEDEKVLRLTQTPGGEQMMVWVTEPGLYSLILGSRKPEAKAFKRWITHEVLPAIRKTGTYSVSLPKTLPDALRAYASEIEAHSQTTALLEAAKPKVLFAESVEASKTSILIGELAKILKQNGVEIGQNRLFDWMRKNGYLINRNGSDYNMPTQYSMELGLFTIKETTVNHSDGHITINKTPKLTGKGQVYFVNKFLSKELTA